MMAFTFLPGYGDPLEAFEGKIRIHELFYHLNTFERQLGTSGIQQYACYSAELMPSF